QSSLARAPRLLLHPLPSLSPLFYCALLHFSPPRAKRIPFTLRHFRTLLQKHRGWHRERWFPFWNRMAVLRFLHLRLSTLAFQLSTFNCPSLQSAATARVRAQLRMAATSSARVTLSGCVVRISAMRISVESCCLALNAVYSAATMLCSISAPLNPSLAAASFGRSNAVASLPRFFKCSP